MSSRIRRVRSVVDNTDELLQSLAEAKRRMSAMALEVSKKEAELFDAMRAVGKTSVEVAGATASITQHPGKSSNIVDPKALFSKLSNGEFFECVTVSVTKVKQYLAAKELERITTTVPGKPGEPTLKVSLK